MTAILKKWALMGWQRALGLTIGVVLAGLCAAPLQAQPASPWVENDHAAVRLISAVDSVGGSETLTFGLQFRMAPRWKIYWRSPGDAGFPPRIDWAGSNNLAGVAIAWPLPQRYTIFGLSTYVYADSVVLPLAVKPQRAGAPLALRARLDYLLCDKVCIPYEAELRLDLAPGAAHQSEHAAVIAQAQARVPPRAKDAGALGLTIERSSLSRQVGQKSSEAILEVLARSTIPFSKPDLLVEGPPQMAFGVPRIDLSENDTLALLRVPVGLAGSKAVWPAVPQFTVTLADGFRAMEQGITPVAQGVAGGLQQDYALLGILVLALLGGLILNVMPCVLPVLSLKLLGAIGQAGRGARAVRASFLATSAGIVVSILALGLAVIALRSAGLAVGWGAQFQQPVFIAIMALVLTLFAANLWGLVSIALPRAIGDAAASDRATRPGLAGDFLTGVFATLLATPCSAPFLGTAVGFALTRGAGEILAVFAALGIGLALPYLLVALVPRLARLLPKPGPWMIWLRRILGVALAATALWLIAILRVQIGDGAAFAVAALLAAIPLLLLLRRAISGRLVVGAVVALAIVAIVVPFAFPGSAPSALSSRAASTDAAWQPFDRVQIFNAVAKGKVVLVDVTADWCITCQANKRLVLNRGDVRRRIESGAVLALRADWTRPDPAIADYLASFGRYGIPFNAVYGPGAPAGIALPELLRAEDVRAAFEKAATPRPAAISAGPQTP